MSQKRNVAFSLLNGLRICWHLITQLKWVNDPLAV